MCKCVLICNSVDDNMQTDWKLLSEVPLVYVCRGCCWRALGELVKTVSECLYKDLNLWPFHFGTVDLIIQILPSGMGHCNWIFSRPKRYFVLFLQLQTAHMVSHHLLGLNSSLGQHTSICFFYIYRCGPATSSIVMLLLLLSKAVKCGIHSPQLTPVSALLLHSFH